MLIIVVVVVVVVVADLITLLMSSGLCIREVGKRRRKRWRGDFGHRQCRRRAECDPPADGDVPWPGIQTRHRLTALQVLSQVSPCVVIVYSPP